jgi:hypothetical protein
MPQNGIINKKRDSNNMMIFEQLSNNKGTVSSFLGKSLAQKVLEGGQSEILLECIDLVCHKVNEPAAKHIRAGAAKVVEIVAEKQPEMVAVHLEELIPSLSVPEPQTRWAIIRVMGFCAHLNKSAAKKAIPYAEKYLEAKEGLCIASSADLFLGDLGALSKEDAELVFPILEQSIDTVITNEQDWLLEALFKVFPNLDNAGQEKGRQFAERWQYSPRKSTQQRARNILKLK